MSGQSLPTIDNYSTASFNTGPQPAAQGTAGSGPRSYAGQYPQGSSQSNQSSSPESSILAALASITKLPVAQIKQISERFRHRHGREATTSDILDLADNTVRADPRQLSADSEQNEGSNLTSLNSDLSDADSEYSCHSGMTADPNIQSQDSDISDSEDDEEDQVDGLHPVQTGLDVVDGPLLGSLPNRANRFTSRISGHFQHDSGVDMASSREIHSNTDSSTDTQQANQSELLDTSCSEMTPDERKGWLTCNTLLVLQREFELLDAARKCTSCKVKPRDTTFLPCGHFMMCKDCSEPVYTCPSCSQGIQATAQTFLS